MKILVIPDVHLKPWIFDRAMEIMESSDCVRAVCVGDIADDWGMQRDVELYEETMKKAVEFAKKYPDTLWCYGNHDLAYLWDKYDHPGFSVYAKDTVCEYFNILDETVDALVDAVNGMDAAALWDDISPIWARPQYNYVDGDMYPPEYFQVVGHTPVRSIKDQGSLLTVDVFSTDRMGRPIGTEDFCRVDTVTKEWEIIS